MAEKRDAVNVLLYYAVNMLSKDVTFIYWVYAKHRLLCLTQ